MSLAFVLGDTGGGSSEPGEPADPLDDEPRNDHLEAFDRSIAAVDVLVVDDDEAVRSTCAEILGTSGYSVAVAEDGEVALSLLGHLDQVGMILLDLKMPHMGGVAFLEALDSVPPVVILSAFALDEDEDRRVGSKVVRHLQKPVDPHELLRVVAATLGGSV